MKFKIAKTYLYWWPVTVSIPSPDVPGTWMKQDFQLQLEPQPREEAIAASEEMAGLTTMREVIEHDVAQTLRVVRDWKGVTDDDGNDMPFSEAALRMALQHTWFRVAVTKAIAASLNGEEARLGN